MSVRLGTAIVSALAVAALAVACSSNEVTHPRPSGFQAAATNAGCTPDMQPPTITFINASPNVLWPPDHKMATVTLHWGAVDNCGSPPCFIASISSNEPVNGTGDGNTSPDWVILDRSTAEVLRAERSGDGADRIYSIKVNCTDAGGNTTLGAATVVVPHDKGKQGS